MPLPMQNTLNERTLAPAEDGRRFWRSLEELAGDDRFAVSLAREFPEYADRLNDPPTRRKFLQLMGASLALAGAQGCVQQPAEEIVPYVRAPEQLILGKPLYYATAFTHDGCGDGLLVESQMGRPVKVEGNPLHPAVPEIMRVANIRSANATDGEPPVRFGPTDAFAQASVLSLYDPDRSQTVLQGGQIDTWESFVSDLFKRLEAFQASGGRGLRLLTQTVVSPTLTDQLQRLLARFPNAVWHQYEPLHADPAFRGAELAFGRALQPIYHLDRADVILSLDADFLVDGPLRLQNAAAFARRRKSVSAANAPGMNRLYVVETGCTLTGASADHRLPMGPVAIRRFTIQLANVLGAAVGGELSSAGSDMADLQAWLDALQFDLQDARGRSLVIAGRGQPPLVHALVHWMNSALGNVGNTVEYFEPIAARSEDQVESLRALVNAVRAREVTSLIIIGGNPVFDAPADFDFAAALSLVPHTVHMSEYVDETSIKCTWHLPQVHFLESWSDTRAADGTAAIVQPLIAPLFRGKSMHELLASLLGNPQPSGHDIVRDFWKAQYALRGNTQEFAAFWQTSLHDGILAGTTSAPLTATIRMDLATALNQEISTADRSVSNDVFQAVFRPAPTLWDGRFANNGWLEELPQPFTTLTWDNAVLIAPQTATSQHLATGDVVEVAVGARRIEIPVCIVPGHPIDTMTLHVGYGRTSAGRVGNGVGANVFPLRTSDAMWNAAASLRKTGRSQLLAMTQEHFLMEDRHLVRAGTAAELQANPTNPAFMAAGHHRPPADVTMYPPHPYHGYKWGMVVDLSKCFGCSACVVACQAENNIPIVGKDQVSRGREMHWLRIDQYYSGEADNPASYHQPVMCQHCELAPCEVVCPVGATTHSDEGLNEMVYNRCVGTRYCSNNCPYKVRRFNFLDYNTELRSDALLQLSSNPDVTVRSRGVMEKCTYCVQRINAARIDSEKENRTIRDGEIVTACQAACPAEAIVFGDLNDPNSAVTQAAQSSLNYSLLGELNTRPRTSYLAAIRNPRPNLGQTTTDQHVE
jgi:MoCo/4Fe-4S cofactor protein with predicted Tat translocation signal